jgi:nucleotide-binding universal stress UspA family protein
MRDLPRPGMAVWLHEMSVMTTNKILCPTDFTPGADQALRTAVRLAKERDAELVLLHSWHLPASAYSELAVPVEAFELMRQDAQRALEKRVSDAKAQGAKRVSSKLERGVPWLAVTHELEDPSYSIAVVSTHGRTGISRMLLGSVAGTIVRHAPTSVLVVPPESEPKPYEHALCPVDFSPSSRDVMFAAAKWVRPGGRITLFHAAEMPASWTGESLTNFTPASCRGGAATELAKWANELRHATDVHAHIRTALGRPATEILEALDSDDSLDLVAMGSHGRTGIKRV